MKLITVDFFNIVYMFNETKEILTIIDTNWMLKFRYFWDFSGMWGWVSGVLPTRQQYVLKMKVRVALLDNVLYWV